MYQLFALLRLYSDRALQSRDFTTDSCSLSRVNDTARDLSVSQTVKVLQPRVIIYSFCGILEA